MIRSWAGVGGGAVAWHSITGLKERSPPTGPVCALTVPECKSFEWRGCSHWQTTCYAHVFFPRKVHTRVRGCWSQWYQGWAPVPGCVEQPVGGSPSKLCVSALSLWAAPQNFRFSCQMVSDGVKSSLQRSYEKLLVSRDFGILNKYR